MHNSLLFNWVPLKTYSSRQICTYSRTFVLLRSVLSVQNFFRYLFTSPYKTSFSGSNSWKIGLFFHPVEHNSRPLGSVDQSTKYTGYTWWMCTTIGVWFKYLTLLVMLISLQTIQVTRDKCAQLYRLHVINVHNYTGYTW